MWHDLFLISPLLLVLTLGLVALLGAAFAAKESFKGWLGYVSTFGFVLAALFIGYLFNKSPGELAFETEYLANSFALDHLSLSLSLAVLLGAIFMSLASVHYLREHDIDHGEFHALIAFAVVGMMGLIMSNDLLTFFISLELMSLAVYVLAGFKRKSQFSTEAATKYFVLGAFASGLLLLGIAFVYGATGTISLPAIADSVPEALKNTPELLRLGQLLLVAAFFFKVAAAPFHMWMPDVYEGAPAPAAGFMAIAVKIAAFGGFARLLITGFSHPELRTEGLSWELLLTIAAVASMFMGNLGALWQKNLKRMLAYSAIAHTGYLFLALLNLRADAEIGTQVLGAGFAFYLLGYALANSVSFGVAAAISGQGRENLNEEAYAGLAKRSPGLALALAIAMLSLFGLPLTVGFIGKLTVFEELLTSRPEYLWLVIVAIVNSIISAWYYLRVILVIYMRDESTEHPLSIIDSRPLKVAVGIAAILTLLVGLLPSRALDMSALAGQSFSEAGELVDPEAE